MTPILLLSFVLALAEPQPPWPDLSLTIERDPSTSSDTVTLCRVRVVNHGARTWAGRGIAFEAQALEGDAVVERVRGRFGLSLGPRETLETLVGFSGRYSRFAVRPLPKSSAATMEQRHGRRAGGKRRAKP